MTSSRSSVAVTGASGFLGSTFCRRLESEGVSFQKILRATSAESEEAPGVIQAELSAKEMADEFSRLGMRTVFHFATHFTSSARFGDSLKAYAANITFSQKVLEAAALANCRFVNFNSYWQLLDDWRATLPYSRSKELFRLLTLSEGISTEMIQNIFLPDTFGPKDRRGKIVEKMTVSAIQGEAFSPANPLQRVNLTFAPRLASYLIEGIEGAGEMPSEVFYVNYTSISLGSLSLAINNLLIKDQLEQAPEFWNLENYSEFSAGYEFSPHGASVPIAGAGSSRELLEDLAATIASEIDQPK